MLPISLYQLTRIDDLELFAKYEQQLSRRKEITEPKDREVSTLREFVNNILGVAAPVSQIIGSLQHFFFAYQIPKIPKEFDLLRLSDEMIINIELKSESDDQKITKQLKQNRHYLKALCKPIQLYAFRKDNNKLYT